ncbi:MAG: (S)-benzoin forming benzil reductase [Desulfobacteraceae bacterium]
MNYYITTGTSSGMGAAVAELLLDEPATQFCISRRKNRALVKLAAERERPLHYLQRDLFDHGELPGLMEEIFSMVDLENAERISLVNNAGTLDPVGPSPANDPEEVHKSVHINLITPMTLSSLFIKHLQHAPVEKTIVNISSGAAKRPIWGWSAYCTTKAAIEMYTRTAAEEQKGREHPVRLFAFSPGIVDTPMQEKIRNTPLELFKNRDNFIEYQEKGNLLDPFFAARHVIALSKDTDRENGALVHI